jgi:uncharacterized protein YacL
MTINWTEVIFSIIGIIFTGVLIPFIKHKLDLAKAEQVDYWLRVFMSAAETAFGDNMGQQKKEYVLNELKKKLPWVDLEVVQDNLEAMFRELCAELILNNPDLTKNK